MKEITLTNSPLVALVDDEDYGWLSLYNWSLNTHGYVCRRVKVGTKRREILMHREVMQATRGQLVDHRKGNRCDNQKSSLRVATYSQNAANRKPKGDRVYKGISFDEPNNVWVARVMIHGQDIYLGSFERQEDAAWAYNQKAAEIFGEFARLNNVPDWADGSSVKIRAKTSQYVGVYFDNALNRWVAVDQDYRYAGCSESEEGAYAIRLSKLQAAV